MRKYQSEPGRLARLFKASREKWRAKAAAKQRKVRALETRVRDLEVSRENWKTRAQAAEREVAEQKRAASAGSDEEAESKSPAGMPRTVGGPRLERAWRHQFPLWLVQWALQQVLVALTSFRGASRSVAGLLEVGWEVAGPSAASIRLWLLRIGLYELQRPRTRGTDWVLIVDLSIQLGPAKVLVIVAVPRSQLPAPPPVLPSPTLLAPPQARPTAPKAASAALRHQAVEVVRVAVLSHSTGDVIEQHLEQAGKSLGAVTQIVADGGSDVKNGIERYCQRHPQSRYTLDVTHAMARLLKHELEADERFGALLRHCQTARQALQQTPLSFLRPPPWRRKGRWLQVGTVIAWAQRALHYAEQGDFSQLDPGHSLDAQAYLELLESLDRTTLTQLNARLWRDYPDQASFLEAMAVHLGAATVARHHQALCQATDRGRRRFEQALGWLREFHPEIAAYAELVELVNLTQQLLKTQGLNTHSPQQVTQAIAQRSWSARAQRFTQGLHDYLQCQTQGLPEGQTFLATSDVLESLFGHYKLFTERGPLNEVGQLILTLPLRTVKLTADFVKKALETVSTADLKRWTAETLGPSALARRWATLGRRKTTKKQQEEYDAASA
jgi:hypothetical protein